jgi:hypothetical protein
VKAVTGWTILADQTFISDVHRKENRIGYEVSPSAIKGYLHGVSIESASE